MADEAAVLWSGFQPTAAELYQEYVRVCGDETVALEEALSVADGMTWDLHRRLGVGR